jgi:hypothetical protein
MKNCYQTCSCAQCKRGCEDYSTYQSIRQGAAQKGISQSEYLEKKNQNNTDK